MKSVVEAISLLVRRGMSLPNERLSIRRIHP